MDKQTTLQRIIEEALALFRDKGYEQTTVNDICAAAGVAKPTFYYHLKSKDDILAHFYDEVIQDMAARLLHVFMEESPWERLLGIFFTLQESTEKIGPELLNQLFIVNLKEDKGTFDMRGDLTELATKLITEGQSRGQIRNESAPLALYTAAAYAFEGYDLMWCVKKGAFDRRAALRKSLEALFDVAPEYRSL